MTNTLCLRPLNMFHARLNRSANTIATQLSNSETQRLVQNVILKLIKCNHLEIFCFRAMKNLQTINMLSV